MKPWRIFSRLRNKLITLFMLITLGPLLVVGLYALQSSSRALTRNAVQRLTHDISIRAEEITHFLSGVKGDVLFLSQTPPMRGIVRARAAGGKDRAARSTYARWVEQLNHLFEAMIRAKPYYMQLRYLDEQGRERVRVDRRGVTPYIIPPEDLQDKSHRDYVAETLRRSEGAVYVSPLNLNRERGALEQPYRPTIRYATPVVDLQGNRKGLVIANVEARQFLALLGPSYGPQEQTRFLVDAEGFYLAHPDLQKAWARDRNAPARLSADYPASVVAQVLSGDQGAITRGEALIAYAPIFPDPQDSTSFWVAVEVGSKRAFLGAVRSFQWGFWILFGLTLIVALAVSLGLATRLSTPITRLVDCAAQMARGDLRTDIPVQRGDELGTLSKALQRVLSIWRGIVGKAIEVATTLSEETSNIVVATRQMADGATSQSEQLTRVSSGMEEMSGSIQEVSRNAQNTFNASKTATAQAEEGAKKVRQTVEGLQQAHAFITNLNQRAQEIGRIVQMIGDIAAQTNILSLNAAIEAARAGEAGRGFNVVAEEIRKLAQTTRTSTEEIQGMTEEIQQAVAQLSTLMNSGMTVAEEAGQSLEDIVEAITSTTEMVETISSAASQQAITAQSIADALHSLSSVTRQTAQSAEESAQATQTLKALSEQLQQITAQFKI